MKKVIIYMLAILMIVTGLLGITINILSSIEQKDEIDNSRVAITVDGHTQNDEYIYVLISASHPNDDDIDLFEDGANAIIPSIYYRDLSFVKLVDTDTYMIELTNILPLDYTNAQEFFDDGGKFIVTLMHYDEDGNRCESTELIINESGNYIVESFTTTVTGKVMVHKVEKFYKTVLTSLKDKLFMSK